MQYEKTMLALVQNRHELFYRYAVPDQLLYKDYKPSKPLFFVVKRSWSSTLEYGLLLFWHVGFQAPCLSGGYYSAACGQKSWALFLSGKLSFQVPIALHFDVCY